MCSAYFSISPKFSTCESRDTFAPVGRMWCAWPATPIAEILTKRQTPVCLGLGWDIQKTDVWSPTGINSWACIIFSLQYVNSLSSLVQNRQIVPYTDDMTVSFRNNSLRNLELISFIEINSCFSTFLVSS